MDEDSHIENQNAPQMASLIKQLKTNQQAQANQNEGSSFWDYLTGDEGFRTSQLPALKLDEIHTLTKSLSDARKKINQKLERIKKELDLLTIKLDSLKLVGGNDEETLERITDLTNQGGELVSELEKLDSNLKLVRDQREQLALAKE